MDNLLDKHLSRFKAIIRGKEAEGIIFIEDELVYLFQNEQNGSTPDETQPSDYNFQFSWCVDDGSAESLLNTGVRNFVLIDTNNQPQNTDKRKLLLLI